VQRTLYESVHAVHVAVFYGLFCDKNVSVKGNFGLNTNLVVSSIEFCQSIFDERDIGRGPIIVGLKGRADIQSRYPTKALRLL
jgi:hypothetical protein